MQNMGPYEGNPLCSFPAWGAVLRICPSIVHGIRQVHTHVPTTLMKKASNSRVQGLGIWSGIQGLAFRRIVRNIYVYIGSAYLYTHVIYACYSLSLCLSRFLYMYICILYVCIFVYAHVRR